MEGVLLAALSANVRRLRRGLGISQEAFGDHVDRHRTYVGGLERAERNLTLETVEALSDQLGVHPLNLLYDHDTMAIVRGADGTPRFVQRDEGGRQLRAADGPIEPTGPKDPGPGKGAPGSKRRPRPRPT